MAMSKPTRRGGDPESTFGTGTGPDRQQPGPAECDLFEPGESLGFRTLKGPEDLTPERLADNE